jgi:predicted component of type VI protein secretion system
MPMRESGGEAGMGTREICQVFDDPIQKAAQWFRAGVLLFEIGPGRYAACRRWLSLFGIAHEDWPEHLLYPLSLLAPALSRMAGREIGIRFAFLVIFGIPVNQIRYKRSYRFLDAEQRSALGSQYGRIGRDFILGDRLGDCDRMIIQLGPVSLDIFEWFEAAEGRRLLQMTAALCVSAYQSFSIEWLIEDAQRAPRLGKPVENSRLGLNFHLGRKGSS